MTGALYSLTLQAHGRRARLLMLMAAGIVAIVVAAAVNASTDSTLDDTTEFIAGYGFAVFAPVASLAIASAVFGDMMDDQTLVYVWLRPVPRWNLVAGPYAATLTIAIPLVTIPLAIAAAVTGDADLVVGTALASVVAVTAYCAFFLALGLRTRRALLWGLAYILVWEGLVASIGGIAAQLAIRSYADSIIATMTDVDLRLGDDPLWVAILIPLVAALVFAAYTTWRLQTMDVD